MDGRRPEPEASSTVPDHAAHPACPGGRSWTVVLFWRLLNCWRQPLLSALEMVVSQLETLSKVKDMFRNPPLPCSAGETKADGAASRLPGQGPEKIRMHVMEWELFEGLDSVASLKCPFSCLLKGLPRGSQRQAHYRVN